MPAWPITTADVEAIVQAIRPLRVAVIGDFCLDVYLRLDHSASVDSLETGLPTRPVAAQRYTLGGAGSAAANLAALGCAEVRAYGVVGDDPFGREMRRGLLGAGIDDSGVLTQSAAWDTCVYTKLLEGSQGTYAETSRIDFGNFNRLSAATEAALLSHLVQGLERADAVIINQQLRQGIHAGGLGSKLRDLITHHPNTLWVSDSRDYSGNFGGSVLKLNEGEALSRAGGDAPLHDAAEAAAALYERQHRPVFVTRGACGSLAADRTGVAEVPGVSAVGETDPVGAGDAYLAGIAVALAVGRSPAQAAAFGGLVAGVTVSKLEQTGTASPREVIELAKRASHRLGT
jgi:sugar/nucleoside kinase (ribokinase family)